MNETPKINFTKEAKIVHSVPKGIIERKPKIYK